jgi:hypothetical protein
VRYSEIIETQKSPDEIRDIIKRNAEKVNVWSAIFFNPKKKFYYELEGNLIHLSPTGLLYWPSIELEMNEFIKPRLKLNYSGFRIFLVVYSLFTIPLILNISQIKSWNDLYSLILPIIIYGGILLYANYMQRNTRNWVIDVFREK